MTSSPAPCDESALQPVAISSPAQRLYRDTLQSIFQFTTLGELHQIRSVCNGWLKATESMPSLKADACCVPSTLCAAADSSLAVHIGRFCKVAPDPRVWRHSKHPKLTAVQFADSAPLSSLHQRSPHLHTLSWLLPGSHYQPIRFPPKLTSVTLNMRQSDLTTAQLVALLTEVGRLALLQRLTLLFVELPTFDVIALIDVAPSLTHLCIEQLGTSHLTDEQVSSLRRCSALVTLRLLWADDELILRLLRLPESRPDAPTSVMPLLRSLHIGAIYDDAAAFTIVACVPTLTELECRFRGDSLDFLVGLQKLQTLDIAIALSKLTSLLTASGLCQCHSLTSLTLRGSDVDPADLAMVLERCDRICALHLSRCRLIHHLDFLSVPRLVTDLTDLDLSYCEAVTVECLSKLQSLRALRRLKLVPDSEHAAVCFSPSELRALRDSLPALQVFEFDARHTVHQIAVNAALAGD